jgi:tryptophanyl-tRNA synthetase
VEVYYDTITTSPKNEATSDSSSGEDQNRLSTSSTAIKLIKPFKEIGKKVKQLVEGEHATKRKDGDGEGDEKINIFSPEKRNSQERDDDIK